MHLPPSLSVNISRALAFPDVIEVGLRVGSWEIQVSVTNSLSSKQGETLAAAAGYFVHVFVNRETRRPVPMPSEFARHSNGLCCRAALRGRSCPGSSAFERYRERHEGAATECHPYRFTQARRYLDRRLRLAKLVHDA